MKLPERTDWLPARVKPKRPGVYERRLKNGIVIFSRWSGKQWMSLGFTLQAAAKQRKPSSLQKRPWRGLTRPA